MTVKIYKNLLLTKMIPSRPLISPRQKYCSKQMQSSLGRPYMDNCSHPTSNAWTSTRPLKPRISQRIVHWRALIKID